VYLTAEGVFAIPPRLAQADKRLFCLFELRNRHRCRIT
jgi:hypothetical protein